MIQMSYDALMPPAVTQPELNLMQYLRKHSGRSGERVALDPKPIMRSLRISSVQFTQDAGSLRAHGYAGMRDYRPNANDVPSLLCSSIWLTKKGEDYLKENVGQSPDDTLPGKIAIKTPVA
jgi:hypothetical protein